MISGRSSGLLLVYIEEIAEGSRHVEVHSVGAVDPADVAIGRRLGHGDSWGHGTPSRGGGAGVPSCNLRLARLVEVAEPEQLGSSGADISDLEDHGLAQLLLHIQVEVLGVGGANVLVRAKKIT